MKNIEKIVKNQKDGVTLSLFVISNSKRNIFPVCFNEWRKTIEIKVVSPAKNNKANLEVIKTISNFFNVSENNILIVSGEKSKDKTVLIKNVTKEMVIKKLMEKNNELR